MAAPQLSRKCHLIQLDDRERKGGRRRRRRPGVLFIEKEQQQPERTILTLFSSFSMATDIRKKARKKVFFYKKWDIFSRKI